MSFILVLLCISSALFYHLRYKNFYNPPFIMAVFWVTITFFSTLGLYNQYIAGNKTYTICFIGLLGFFVGCLVDKKIVLRKCWISRKKKTQQMIITANNKFVAVVLIVLVLILSYRVIRVMTILRTGIQMKQIRVNFNGIVLRSPFERAFNTYIVMPMVFLLPAITIPEFVAFRKNIKNLLLTIIVLIEYAVCDGGRVPFYYCAIFTLCSIYIFHVDFKKLIPIFRSKNKKNKYLSAIVVLAIAIVDVYMMIRLSGRRDIRYSLGNSIYTYFTGCFPFLEYHINQIDQNNVFTYGSAFFHGILQTVFYVLNTIKLCQYPAFYNYVHQWGNVQEFVHIGSANFNAFVTPFYYFYMDYRYIGVFLGGLAYGLLSIQIYHRMKSQKNYQYKYIAAYLLIVQSIVTSMVRWQFYNANFVMAFVFLILFPSTKITLETDR